MGMGIVRPPSNAQNARSRSHTVPQFAIMEPLTGFFVQRGVFWPLSSDRSPVRVHHLTNPTVDMVYAPLRLCSGRIKRAP